MLVGLFNGDAVDGLVVSQPEAVHQHLEGSLLTALQNQTELVSISFWMMLVAARKVAQNLAGDHVSGRKLQNPPGVTSV